MVFGVIGIWTPLWASDRNPSAGPLLHDTVKLCRVKELPTAAALWSRPPPETTFGGVKGAVWSIPYPWSYSQSHRSRGLGILRGRALC